jgi:hypothetical protein
VRCDMKSGGYWYTRDREASQRRSLAPRP